MANKSTYKYTGTKNGVPQYGGSPFVVESRSQAPINRKPIKLPDLVVNFKPSFPKSVRKSAKKGMKNLNLKSSK